MGRAIKGNQAIADEVLRACQALQAKTDEADMAFLSHLLGIVIEQAQNELTTKSAGDKRARKPHPHRSALS